MLPVQPLAPLHRGNWKVFHSLDMTDLLLLSCEFLSAQWPHHPTRRGPEVSSELFSLLSPLKQIVTTFCGKREEARRQKKTKGEREPNFRYIF